jgi:hypothetical protein
MNDVTVARALHVLSIVLWIGGVGFVTTVLLPGVRRLAVWLLFTVVLFVAEPLFLHRWLLAREKAKSQATFRLLEWLHWVWLILGGHHCRRGGRHPRSAVVRVIGKRGTSAVVATIRFSMR